MVFLCKTFVPVTGARSFILVDYVLIIHHILSMHLLCIYFCAMALQLSDSISACKYWCVLPMWVTHIYVYKLFASHLDDFFHIYKLIKFYKIQHMNMAQIMSFEYMYVRRNNLSLSRLCVGHIKPTTTTKTISHCTHCEFTIFPSPFENIKCYLTYEALDLLAIFTNISRI